MMSEKLKTVLLLLLFVISVFLTKQLWIALPLGEAISNNQNYNFENLDTDVADVLSPRSFTINFGGGRHTVFFSEPYETWNINDISKKEKISIWSTVKYILKGYFTRRYEVESVDLNTWQNLNKFKSIKMDFGCEIPGESLIKVLSGNSNISQKNIGTINSLLIPAVETEKTNIYMGNTNKNVYFKFVGKELNYEIRNLINNIEEIADKEDYYISYYPLKKYVPINSDNKDILIPYLEEIAIPTIEIKNEIDVLDRVQIKSLSNKFFGENFNFVKEIKEKDGSIIYIYGYGEKALKINAEGLLEHIERVNKQRVKGKIDFLKTLKIAVAFINEHLDWPINAENAYLSYCEKIKKDKKEGYRFYFNYRLNGLPIFIPQIGEEKAIEIEVIGNQVTYYKRFIKRKRTGQKEYRYKKVPLITEILAKNIDYIKKDYMKDNNLVVEIEDIQILETMKDIGLVYYCKDDKLIPVWKIVFGNNVYYFDVYSGEMLHHYKRGV
ncbi:Two-component signal transduction system YycFG, regulatory protein YycH [Caminicella sporogenes DSM 14501]|uniref:Two-component signal transduction system YycFG, regulatory protein YycH n=1 Tax=Caminicella sporogenes DSM 14501 TaxID=1121266 RepID=A0A1M6NH93_9FIRM|nr:hypothetical protein [Caminicella sporogenes]RKD22203.1 hypothetical protein BET04_06170 [Caminicella sporogenes]SHJ95070.1 Two-component signal transduction system YycFG, regulatory protein YycH [Caminicella sporogenes DSM 14501]